MISTVLNRKLTVSKITMTDLTRTCHLDFTVTVFVITRRQILILGGDIDIDLYLYEALKKQLKC